MIEITINDRTVSLEGETSLASLLTHHDLDRPFTAIALNDCVIPRSKHQLTTLHDGDVITIVEAVGGG